MIKRDCNDVHLPELGFRRMKTGLALYHPDRISKLAGMGFI